jgi:nitrogenase-stabilizing/protective protein
MTMSCIHTPELAPDIMAKLRKAASAEEFFTLLGVAYDPKVLNVARLHILKRMGEYLAGEDIDGVPDRVAAARCRSVLERAYEEFVTTSPLEARVFKVLKQAVEPPKPPAFVPFDSLLK